jgi:PAS domain S-box-containing protein
MFLHMTHREDGQNEVRERQGDWATVEWEDISEKFSGGLDKARRRTQGGSDRETRQSPATPATATRTPEDGPRSEDAQAVMRSILHGLSAPTTVEAIPIGIALLDGDGEIIGANTRAEELLGLEASEMEGRSYTHPAWNIWDEAGDQIPPEDHPVSTVMETGEAVQGFIHGITLPDGAERWLASNVAPILDEDGYIEQIVVALEDVTELKRLERLIEAVQPVVELLNYSTSRTDLEQDICDVLTDTREYDVAWVAKHTGDSTLFDPHVRSDIPRDAFDEIDLPLTDPTADPGPARTAIETGEVEVADNIRTDPRFQSHREEIVAHDLQSAAAVPFVHKDRVSGVLGLYTRRADAFDSREQTLLKTLGMQAGHVIHALETEQLLHADKVVELTFRSTDRGSFLVRASEDIGCTLEVTGTIPTADDALLRYVSVEGAPITALEELATQSDRPVETRTIQQQDGGTGVVEVLSSGQSLAHALMTRGAVVTADRIVNGEAEVVCEIPMDQDIAGLVRTLKESFPETELVAKREFDRSAGGRDETSEEILADVFESELSDRQRQVLRAAVYSGYFQSPRLSTATEIAEALSLTQSTVSYHLRKAERTLFEGMLERL